MLLLPSVDGRHPRRHAMGRPHLVDKRFPGLPFVRPVRLGNGRILFQLLEGLGFILEHPAVAIIEESVVIPGPLSLHEAQRQGLRHPGRARATAPVRFTQLLAAFLPGRRQGLFVRPRPGARHSGRLVDGPMPGKYHFGAGPRVAVGGLFIFAKVCFGKGLVDRGPLVVAQEQTRENDGQFATAAVPAESFPTGMPRANHAAQVNAHLDKVHQQSLLLLGLEVGAEKQGILTHDASVIPPILRHVLDRFLEAEKARRHPGPLREPDKQSDVRQALGGRGRKQVPLQVAGQVDFGLTITESRAESVRSERRSNIYSRFGCGTTSLCTSIEKWSI